MSGPSHGPRRRGPDGSAPPTAGAVPLLRGLVRLFPREFRRRFGAELLDLLARRDAEERRRGHLAAWRFRWATSLQLLRDALLERARLLADGGRSGRRIPSPLSSRDPTLPRLAELMDSLRIDLRDALRALLRSPGVTAVLLVTLAMAIGATTSVFSVVNGVLLTPLPYRDPDRIVVLWETTEGEEPSRGNLSPANYLDWTDADGVFAAAVATQAWGPTLTGTGDADRLAGARVSRGFFEVVGVEPALGRGFTAEEDRPGGPRVVVLSHEAWQSRLAGQASVLGTEIILDDEPYTVIGVMPPGFRGPLRRDAEGWAPLAIDAADPDRDVKFLRAVGRLEPGVTLTEARQRLDAVSARLHRLYPDSTEDLAVWVTPLREELVRDVHLQLWLMLGAVVLVLLIATANVANLQIARASGRAGELAMRAALGAHRGRLVRGLLVESLVLSLSGGLLGLLSAWWGTRSLLAIAPSSIPRLEQVAMDTRVMAFALLASGAVGILFGILPALHGTGRRLTATLRAGGRDRDSGSRGGGLRRGLVVTQIAVALVLIAGSGLLLKSLQRLRAERTGFAPGTVVTGLSLGNAYEDVGSFVEFHDRLLERLRARPETERVATVSVAPFSGNKLLSWIDIPGGRAEAEEGGIAWILGASDGLFATLEVRVQRGREFTQADGRDSMAVAVVNRSFVDDYLPGEDVLGREITVGMTFDAQPPERPRRIVGVVDDMRLEGLDAEPGPQVFVPYRQYPTRFFYAVVRGDGDVAALTPVLRDAVRQIDPRVPLGSVATLREWIGASVAGERFYTLVLSAFGLVALTLGAVGIAGIVAHAVTRRRREFGIRLALGASRTDILRLVMREGLLLTLAGLAVGLPSAALLTHFLEDMLHDVGALDPAVFALTAGLLTAIALQASFLPARRATRVDPMTSLRDE